MFGAPVFGRRRRGLELETERLRLRLPEMTDHAAWTRLRRDSASFLKPWEPVWARDHLSRPAFRNRVVWARRVLEEERGAPLFIIRRVDGELIGAITLDNIRRGPAQAGTVGYWVGEPHRGEGYMTEALRAVRRHAFGEMGLSRLEAACLEENHASRKLLERCGFVLEGRAEAYLQIAGRWRDHVLYAALNEARRDGAPAPV